MCRTALCKKYLNLALKNGGKFSFEASFAVPLLLLSTQPFFVSRYTMKFCGVFGGALSIPSRIGSMNFSLSNANCSGRKVP